MEANNHVLRLVFSLSASKSPSFPPCSKRFTDMYHLALEDAVPDSLVGHFVICAQACRNILPPAQLNHVSRLNGGTLSHPRPSNIVLRPSQPCPTLSQATSRSHTEPKSSADAPKRPLLYYTSTAPTPVELQPPQRDAYTTDIATRRGAYATAQRAIYNFTHRGWRQR